MAIPPNARALRRLRRIEIKMVKALYQQEPGVAIEDENAAQSTIGADAPPSKISEMLRIFGENLRTFGEIGASRASLSPFYHGCFLCARLTRRVVLSSLLTRYKVREGFCENSNHQIRMWETSK
jgi:hypothetical protein